MSRTIKDYVLGEKPRGIRAFGNTILPLVLVGAGIYTAFGFDSVRADNIEIKKQTTELSDKVERVQAEIENKKRIKQEQENRAIRQTEQLRQRAIERKKRQEIENPGNYRHDESDTLTLARLLYAETRSEYENPEILEHKASSVLNDANEKNISIKHAIFREGRYKAVRDGNKPYFFNTGDRITKSEIDRSAWETCYKIAEELLENGPEYETEYAIVQRKGEPDPKQLYRSWTKDFTEIAKIPTKRGDMYHFYKD